MAEFKTPRISEPNTGGTKVTPRARPDVRQGQLDALVKGTVGAGKSLAESSGADLSGADLTLAEVNSKADATQSAIDASFETKVKDIGGVGPLQENTAREIVDENLTSFATDFRTLKELRDRGVIGSIEARARSQLMLQRSLSNPLNSLFKKEFLNASAGLTGGGAGAAKALFPNTSEEERNIEIQKQQNKAIAEEEAAVTTTALKTGQSVDFIRKERQAQAIDAQVVQRIKQQETQQKLAGNEVTELHNSFQNIATRTLMSNMSALSVLNDNNGLDARGIDSMQRAVDNDYQGFLADINGRNELGFAERDQLRKSVKSWKEGMDASIKLRESASLDKKLIEELESMAKIVSIKNFPKMAILKQVDPRMLDLFFKLGGNTGATFDRLAGEGAGERIEAASKQLSAAADFTSGRVVRDPKLLPAVFNTKEGSEYVGDNASGELGPQFKKMYNEASEESLRMFNSPSFRLASRKNESVRTELVSAMGIVKKKMIGLKEMLRVEGEAITVESVRAQGRSKTDRIVLNLPESMLENQGEIKQIFRTIKSAPWSWEHVQEDYTDEVDAFNGYMRGEFDLATNFEGGTAPTRVERDRRGRPKVETPADTASKEAELQNIIAQEEAGTLDDDARQARVRDFENRSKTGFDGSVWTPHTSREGGNDTIAYGHKLTDDEAKSGSIKIGDTSVSIDKGITESQAIELFQQDWNQAGKGLNRILKENSLESLPPSAKGIVQEMVFQLGATEVAKFKMLKSLKVGDFAKASDDMLNTKWAKQDSPDRAKTLASEMRKLG